MTTINWINGQAGGTPLSAENLNLMQQYISSYIDAQILAVNNTINKLKETILFNSNSGTSTGFSLSESLASFKYVEVIGKRGEGQQCSARAIVNSTGTTSISLVSPYYGYGDNMWIDQLGLAINGTTATITNYSSLNGVTGSLKVEHSQNISILRVIGYKEVTE